MDKKLAAILEMLAVDRVRSVFGLCHPDPQAAGVLQACVRRGLVKISRHALRPTGYSRRAIPTDIAMLSEHGRRAVTDHLGRSVPACSLADGMEHALGVAELRQVLQIPPGAWTAASEIHATHFSGELNQPAQGLPDALADVDGMRLALEYDHGRYTAVQVRLKQETFRHIADSAVWAVPTHRRARWLIMLGCQHVIVVPIRLGSNKGSAGSSDLTALLTC